MKSANCHLDFGIWNLASGIAEPRQAVPRNDTPLCHCEGSSSFVIARHGSAEAIAVGGKEIVTHLSGARNDTLILSLRG